MATLSNETLPLTVDNTGFLLDRLGADCHPLQFLRELTQNSIEAIQRTPSQSGEIVWDVDWTPYELGEHAAYKLCVTDNGCGMTGQEMVKYINQLSSSAHIQRFDGNYGVGAKIAAATRNHSGLIYLSWKDGRGSMIHLWRDPNSGQYGLRQIRCPDSTYAHFADIDDAIKPELIDQNGTRIILYGMTDDADTMKAPPEAASPSQWIAKYLNTRYFRIPEGIVVRARQGWEQPRSNKDVNVLRTLAGQSQYLESHKVSSGTVQLTGAVAHWYILKDEPALSQNSGYIESSGHVAALYSNELYEMASGRSGYARLQQFGIIFGHRQVVIYIEPVTDGVFRVATNTARTQLLLNGELLPWTDWATEFRASIPEDIRALMDEIASRAATSDHSKSIRERLKALMDLYKVSRYKPSPNGGLRIDEPHATAGGQVDTARRSEKNNEGSGGGGGRLSKSGPVGGIYATFLKSNGVAGIEVKPNMFPEVTWVSRRDGTRELDEIEDKAARYLPEGHLLKINADFRVFEDMIHYWCERYVKEHGEVGGLRELVRDSVHNWYEQALVETIIGIQALKGSREWSQKQIESALSEESLTSVVMQRYHPFNSVKRELGTRIAPLKK